MNSPKKHFEIKIFRRCRQILPKVNPA